MKNELAIRVLLAALLFSSCTTTELAEPRVQGKFRLNRDFYLAHFDLKTDVDDVHSVAAVATMLADPRFSDVCYHAVAGAYGIQDGPYVNANEVFELAFGTHWSDAHTEFDQALARVTRLAIGTLRSGGNIWIADGGQSDFSAALVRELLVGLPDADIKERVHIVQHSGWNEEVTTPEDLAFVRQAASYHKIPDGNAVGNGTPGFRSDQEIDWRRHVTDPRLNNIWERAVAIANTYNGVDGRYLNASIKQGGLDFSDTTETAWIFGFEELADGEDFFEAFGAARPSGGPNRSPRCLSQAEED